MASPPLRTEDSAEDQEGNPGTTGMAGEETFPCTFKNLRHSYEILLSTFDPLCSPIFCKAPSGQFLGGNGPFHRLVSDLADAPMLLPTLSLTQLLHPPTDGESALLDQGNPLTYTITSTRADGSSRRVLVSQAALRDEAGKVVMIVGTIHTDASPDTARRSIDTKTQLKVAENGDTLYEMNEHLNSVNHELFQVLSEREQLERQLEDTCKQLAALVGELNLAEEKERRRISTELHDTVVQDLALAQLRLTMWRPSSASDSERLIDFVNEVLEKAMAQVRGTCFDLSPPSLYEVGVVEAIASLGERLSRHHDFRFDISARVPDNLPAEIRILLFQTVRELLTNAVKHGHPKRVTAKLKQRGGELHVMISDDGNGFRTGWKKGFGLTNIRQRISLIGGWLRITSQPGRTSAEVMVPIAMSDSSPSTR